LGNFLGAFLGTSFGALESSSGAASGTFGKQVSETAFGNSFANNFLEQLWGAVMRGAAFDNTFWKQPSECSFGKSLWEAAFGSNFGEHLVVREESRASDWYYPLLFFVFFSFWGVRLSATLGRVLASICWVISKSNSLFCDGRHFYIVAWD